MKAIFSYTHGDQVDQKIGGILAMRELIDCTSAAAEAKVIKFASTLATVLKMNTDFKLIELVADALGHMARNSPVSSVDFVESELNRALEWLRGDQPHRRLAACAVLQQVIHIHQMLVYIKIKAKLITQLISRQLPPWTVRKPFSSFTPFLFSLSHRFSTLLFRLFHYGCLEAG